MKRKKGNKSGASDATPRKKEHKGAVESAGEYDRRGKPLPPRQRVGGIITPQ